MPDFQRLMPPLMATAVGIVSGLYIFAPLMVQGSTEKLAQNAASAEQTAEIAQGAQQNVDPRKQAN